MVGLIFQKSVLRHIIFNTLLRDKTPDVRRLWRTFKFDGVKRKGRPIRYEGIAI